MTWFPLNNTGFDSMKNYRSDRLYDISIVAMIPLILLQYTNEVSLSKLKDMRNSLSQLWYQANVVPGAKTLCSQSCDLGN